MRENLTFSLEDPKNGVRELVLQTAEKGFLIKINDIVRFNGISFSLNDVNERFANWINWGVIISYTGKQRKPKALSVIKENDQQIKLIEVEKLPNVEKKRKRRKKNKQKLESKTKSIRKRRSF